MVNPDPDTDGGDVENMLRFYTIESQAISPRENFENYDSTGISDAHFNKSNEIMSILMTILRFSEYRRILGKSITQKIST